MLAVASVRINPGNCSGLTDRICFLTGEGRAFRTFAAGLVSVSSLFAAKSMTSLMCCNIRLSVSIFPRALSGSGKMTNWRAVSSLTGWLPIPGNTYFSGDRQISLTVFSASS